MNKYFSMKGGEKMKKHNFLTIAAISFFVSFIGLISFVQPTEANESHINTNVAVCHCQGRECTTVHVSFVAALLHLQHHDNDYRGECKEEPTVTPTETPSPTEEVTPTATPEATLAPAPHGDGIGQRGPETKAPGPAVCNVPFDAPKLQGFERINPSSVKFEWWKSLDAGVENQALIFGYASDKLEYGVILPKDSSSYTVEGLEPNKTVFAQVWSLKQGCAEKSAIIDP